MLADDGFKHTFIWNFTFQLCRISTSTWLPYIFLDIDKYICLNDYNRNNETTDTRHKMQLIGDNLERNFDTRSSTVCSSSFFHLWIYTRVNLGNTQTSSVKFLIHRLPSSTVLYEEWVNREKGIVHDCVLTLENASFLSVTYAWLVKKKNWILKLTNMKVVIQLPNISCCTL